MFSRFFCFLFMLISALFSLYAQGGEPGNHAYVIRGGVYVDFEPIYAGHIDEDYPLDTAMAGRRALEEASLFFSSMIYGWSFFYEPGEKARRTEENLELEIIAEIEFGDSNLRVTDTGIRDSCFWVWMDYHLDDAQQRRMQMWRSGTVRNAQATGYAPYYIKEYPGWLGLRKIVLEDAAKSAIRTMLRGSERNRPKEASGFISLASFPRYYIDSGRLTVFARFRVQVTEIVPFAAY